MGGSNIIRKRFLVIILLFLLLLACSSDKYVDNGKQPIIGCMSTEHPNDSSNLDLTANPPLLSMIKSFGKATIHHHWTNWEKGSESQRCARKDPYSHTLHFSEEGFNISPFTTSDEPLLCRKDNFNISEVWELLMILGSLVFYHIFCLFSGKVETKLLTVVFQIFKTVLSVFCHLFHKHAKQHKPLWFLTAPSEEVEEYFEDDLSYKGFISALREVAEKRDALGAKHSIFKVWLRRPFEWFTRVSRNYKVYTFYELTIERVASYRPLDNQGLPDFFSPIIWSDAGFFYTGTGSSVRCIGCRKELSIMDFRSVPTDCQYHTEGCSFIRNQSNSEELSPPELSIPNEEGSEGDEGFDESEGIEADSAPFASEEMPQEPQPSSMSNETMSSSSAAPQGNTHHESHTPISTGTNSVVASLDVNGGGGEDKEEERNAVSTSSRNSTFSNSSGDSGFVEGTVGGASAAAASDETSSAGNPMVYSENPPDNGILDDDISTPEHSINEPFAHRCQDDFKAECKKNPGHFAYFPASKFTLNQIPSNVRFPAVLQFLHMCAAMTVRICVSVTSDKRPRGEPARRSFTHGKRRIGTGNAFNDYSDQFMPNKSTQKNVAKWKTVKKYMPFLTKGKQGLIFIETNRHVVYNDEEAEATTVDFFYNTPDRKGVVTVKGHSVMYRNLLGSTKTILVCRTSNLKLVENLNKTRQDMRTLVNNFPQNVKEGLTRRLFVISHPHGAEKVLSYGESVLVKYLMAMDKRLVKINSHQQANHPLERLRKVLLYTADTCEGSSGAPVIMFRRCGRDSRGQDNILMETWIHNGIDTTHSLNGSIMEACLEADLSRNAYSSPRENRQNDLNNDPNDEGNKPITTPVFTVMGHPTHPAYIAYEKRLESLRAGWEANHIHKPEELAFAGFFYAGYSDCVRCFQCGLGLRSWKPGDNMYVEHKRHRPNCQFLQMQLRMMGENREGADASASPAGENTANRGDGQGDTVPKISMVTQTNHQQEPSCASKCHEMTKASVTVPAPQEITVGYVFNEGEAAAVAAQNNTSATAIDTPPNPAPAQEEPLDQGKSLALKVLMNENERLQKQLKCKVCFKAPIKDLFLPCGELYACTDCSKLLTNCPSCGKKILATVTTYLT